MTFDVPWSAMADAAWAARENARTYGPTKVGAAVATTNGSIYSGCNIEHRYRSHDIHAEVNALASMQAASSSQSALAIVIAAERNSFTPCGACLDWIFELGGGGETLVGFVSSAKALRTWTARELMPYYPT